VTSPSAAGYAEFAAQLTAGGLISDPWFEGQPRFEPRPVVLTAAEQAALYRAAEEIATAYNELCLLCAADPALTAGFLGLTPVQQALWCASAPHWHGIARADVFLTAAGPVVCELNCDTPSGEAEAVLLNRAVAPAFPELSNPNRALGERFCGMIAAVAASVRRSAGAALSRGSPLSLGLIYPTEMPEDLSMVLLYREWFEERGWRVTLGSPFNLRSLGAGRAGLFDVPCDVFLRHYKTDWWTERVPAWADEPPVPDPEPLCEKLAVILGSALAGTCAVVNPFGAIVPQNKRAMALMWERMDLFSAASRDAIRRYLPETVRLEALPRARLLAEREGWVLKSDYGCEGDEVIIGADIAPDIWEASVDAALPGRWIAQRHFRALRGPDGTAANHGVYLVAGEAAGLYTRLAAGGTDRHAVSAPVLVLPEARS
jgi:glutathionylspermidine synthase